MDVVTVFLDTAAIVRPVVTADPVVAAWERPSALAGMTVGGLAAHLARAVLTVDGYLDGEPPADDAPVLDAAGYLTGAVPDTHADCEVNQQVLARAEAGAERGPAAVAGSLGSALARLIERLPGEPLERTLAVLGGRAIRLDEYLVTRLTELVVHTDDLVASVADVDPPPLPDAACAAAVALLAEVARRRCSTTELVTALARRERASATAPRAF